MRCGNLVNGFFERWRKRKAIKSYIRKLGPLLVKRYGKQHTYTAAQVKRTVDENGFNADYVCYAYSTYLSPADFEAVHREMGQTCDYEAMRSEVAESHFHGHSDFTVHDVFHEAQAHHGDFLGGSEHSHHDFSGGDSGSGHH